MSLKERVRELLDQKALDAAVELARREHGAVRYLFSFLYSTDDLLHWRAAEVLGMIAALQIGNAADGGRNIPRRLVWSLAEESGATAWPATEAMGATVAASPWLFADFASITLSFIDDPRLQRGVLWSARKIAEARPDLTRRAIPKVIELLESPDPVTRGHAAWALGAMGADEAIKALKSLSSDSGALSVYNNGELVKTTVGELARASVAEILAPVVPRRFETD